MKHVCLWPMFLFFLTKTPSPFCLHQVLLADPRDFRVQHTLDAHNGSILSMDVTNNEIVTCGLIQSSR